MPSGLSIMICHLYSLGGLWKERCPVVLCHSQGILCSGSNLGELCWGTSSPWRICCNSAVLIKQKCPIRHLVEDSNGFQHGLPHHVTVALPGYCAAFLKFNCVICFIWFKLCFYPFCCILSWAWLTRKGWLIKQTNYNMWLSLVIGYTIFSYIKVI